MSSSDAPRVEDDRNVSSVAAAGGVGANEEVFKRASEQRQLADDWWSSLNDTNITHVLLNSDDEETWL